MPPLRPQISGSGVAGADAPAGLPFGFFPFLLFQKEPSGRDARIPALSFLVPSRQCRSVWVPASDRDPSSQVAAAPVVQRVSNLSDLRRLAQQFPFGLLRFFIRFFILILASAAQHRTAVRAASCLGDFLVVCGSQTSWWPLFWNPARCGYVDFGTQPSLFGSLRD